MIDLGATILRFFLVLLIGYPLFSADRFAEAAPVVSSPSSQSYYKLLVIFKKQLSSDDQTTITKTMGLMASNPIVLQDRQITLKPPTFPNVGGTVTSGEVLIVIIGPALSDSEKDSVEKFASSMVDSYISRHGNGAASVAMNDADPPNARRQLDDVQRFLDKQLLGDIAPDF